MKKKIFVLAVIIVMASACFFNVLFALVPNPNPTEDNGGSGVIGQLWHRYDNPCPKDEKREKTDCKAGGWSQCEAKYCN